MLWTVEAPSELIPSRVEEVNGRIKREMKLGMVLAIMIIRIERVRSLGWRRRYRMKVCLYEDAWTIE